MTTNDILFLSLSAFVCGVSCYLAGTTTGVLRWLFIVAAVFLASILLVTITLCTLLEHEELRQLLVP